MKLLRRNTVPFVYRPYAGEAYDVTAADPGDYRPSYGDPVSYRGNISPPDGLVTDNLFGLGVNYSHVLVMDDPNADIDEYGIVEWNDESYDVIAVRRSLNVLSVALRQRTANRAVM